MTFVREVRVDAETRRVPKTGNSLARGRFVLLQLLGEGGMGNVYLAEDRKLESSVAIKLIIARYRGRPERERRLITEGELLRRVGWHPNIVRGLEYGHISDYDDWPYVLMEYVDGIPLAEQLRKSGPLEVLRAVRMAHQIAAALQAVHRAGVVHRDVTSRNVLVLSDQQVKLIDFSHAGTIESPRGQHGAPDRFTRAHEVPGTHQYMSPEQAQGRAADFKMDVFSFGIVLYEMLLGTNPFSYIQDRDVYISMQSRGVLETPHIDRLVFRTIPASVAELVETCTHRDPGRRPSMIETSQWLEQISRELGDAPMQPSDRLQRRAAREFTAIHTEGEPPTVLFPRPTTALQEAWERERWANDPAEDAPRASPAPRPLTEVVAAVIELDQPPPPIDEPVPDDPESVPRERIRAIHTEVAPAAPRNQRWVDVTWFVTPMLLVAAWLWFDRPPPEFVRLQTTQLSATQVDHLQVDGALDPFAPRLDPVDVPAVVPPVVQPPTPSLVRSKRPPDACPRTRTDAHAAAERRDWGLVLRLTGKPECWPQPVERVRLRVAAFAEQSRWNDCVREGSSSTDQETKRWVDLCRKLAK